MRIAGNLETLGEFHERRAERFTTDIAAGVRERGRSRIDIEVVDLSTHGCRIEYKGMLVVGAQAWLTLPGLEGWSARVAWMKEREAGLDFLRPLHPAVAARVIGAGGTPRTRTAAR